MKHFLRIISITLLLAMMLSCVASCGLLDGVNTDTGSSDISSIVESILTGSGSSSDSGWLYPDDELETDPDNPTIPPILFPDEEEDTGTKPPVLVPDEDNTDSGDDNTGSGDNNTGSGDDNTGSGDNNTGSGDDNTGSGDNNTGSGDDNPGSGDNNTGSGDDNTGSGDNNTGSGDDNTGSGDNNTGSGDDNIGSGDNNTGSGDDNTDSGDNNTGSGDDNTGSGDDNTGSGDDNTGSGDDNTEEEEPESITLVGVSYDPYDYIGDIEAFVYGLMINGLEDIYHVYPGYVLPSNEIPVYGLIYTSYEDMYYDEDDPNVTYVDCGFLPFPGEPEISDDEFNAGLFIYNLDYQDEETIFVWSYASDAFADHCVVFDLYLIYGVDENGCIFYQARDYVRGYCDESLGNLYSYDEGRDVFVNEVEEYVPISAKNIAELVDFDEMQAELDANIEEQAKKFAKFNVESAAYIAQEGVYDFLLARQEETVLGVPLPDLLEAVKDLDPMSVFRITDEGIKVIDITDPPPPQASNTSKWIVGCVCAVVVIGMGVCENLALNAVPYLPIPEITSAVSSMAIEIFMQVVIEGTHIGHMDWRRIGIAAAYGALEGLISHATFGFVYGNSEFDDLSEMARTALRISLEASGSALVNGMEQATIAFAIDGERDFGKLVHSFGFGAVIGGVVSFASNWAAEGIGKGVNAMLEKIGSKISAKGGGKVVAKVSAKGGKEAAKEATESWATKLANKILKKASDSDKIMARYAKWMINAANNKNTIETVERLVKKSTGESLDKLIKLGKFVDPLGNVMTRSQIYEAAAKSTDGAVFALVRTTVKSGEKVVNCVVAISNVAGKIVALPQNVPVTKIASELVHELDDVNIERGIRQYIEALKAGNEEAPDWLVDLFAKAYPDASFKSMINEISPKDFRNLLRKFDAVPKFDKATNSVIFFPDKFTKNTLDYLISHPTQELRKSLFDTLTKNIYDANGRMLTKEEINKIASNAINGEIIGYAHCVVDGVTQKIPIRSINSLPNLDYSEKSLRLAITEGLGLNRTDNFLKAVKSLRNCVANGEALDPDFVEDVLKAFPQYKTVGEAFDALSDGQILDFITNRKTCRFVFHESLDGYVYLVNRAIHDAGSKDYPGIAHAGWISISNQLKALIGSQYLGEFINAAGNGATYIADSLKKAS